MINYKNYIGCHVKIQTKERGEFKGLLVEVLQQAIALDVRPTKRYFVAGEYVRKDEINSLKITKKAEDLSMKEWELYCVNILGIHLGSVSVTRNGFSIKGYQLDGETIVPFDEEIDMLKLNGEGLDDE